MASGDTLYIWSALNNEPPSSSYATLDIRNSRPVLDFDADSDEEAVFSGIMPQAYAATTGVTVYLHTATNSTGGNVVWTVDFERVGDEVLDTDSDSFTGSPGSATVAAPSTAGAITIDSIARTDGAQMDSVAAGEYFRVKVSRDANHASDTNTGDAQLFLVEMRET